MKNHYVAKKLKWLTILLFFLNSYNLFSQEMPGISFSNYSGISGSMTNPAFLTGSKVYFDVNILGGDIFFNNTFGYIPKDSTNIWKLLRGGSLPTGFGAYGYNSFYKIYPNRKTYNFTAISTIMGPSIMVQNKKSAFGTGIRIKNFETSFHFPGNFLKNIYYDKSDSLNKDELSKNFGFSSLTWYELHFDYAYDFYERYGNKWTIGIEAKILFGIEGFYSSVNRLKYHWINKNQINIDTLSTSLGIALPINYNNANKINLKPLSKGHGLGFNIGILYTKNENPIKQKGGKALCAQPYENYKYRIGFSILDIGSIKFNKTAQLHQINTSNKIIDINNIYGDFSTVNSTMKVISQLLLGDSTASLKDTTFTMSLPTAVSFQYDYHYRKNIFISGFWIHPLRFQNKSLRRPSQLAIIPRYDTRLLGISIPVSLYDYHQMRLGLAIRIYTLTIGTDKLGTLLGTSNLSGMDFYFNLKFNFLKGTCLTWKKGACSKNKKRALDFRLFK